MGYHNPAQLRMQVRKAYSRASQNPEGKHPFPVGRRFAESLGYPRELLDDLPCDCLDSFSGVSNVSMAADLPPEATVLDLGCGAGLDSLIAARRIGPKGAVIGVDFSESMLSRARRAASRSGLHNVLLCLADAERLPLRDGEIEAAMVNGIFNLNPARDAIFSELARVLRPGGVAFVAELILREPLPERMRAGEENWFA
jgi:SAM-dependent methyltransferase